MIQWTKSNSVDVTVLMLASCLPTSHYPHTSPQVVCHLSAWRISNNLAHPLRDHRSQSLIPNPVHDHSHNALPRSLTRHHRTTSLNLKNTSSTPSVSQHSLVTPPSTPRAGPPVSPSSQPRSPAPYSRPPIPHVLPAMNLQIPQSACYPLWEITPGATPLARL